MHHSEGSRGAGQFAWGARGEAGNSTTIWHFVAPELVGEERSDGTMRGGLVWFGWRVVCCFLAWAVLQRRWRTYI